MWNKSQDSSQREEQSKNCHLRENNSPYQLTKQLQGRDQIHSQARVPRARNRTGETLSARRAAGGSGETVRSAWEMLRVTHECQDSHTHAGPQES